MSKESLINYEPAVLKIPKSLTKTFDSFLGMSGVGSVERSVFIWRKLVLKGLADNREEGLARSLNLEVSMIGVQAGDVVASC